MGLKDMTFCKIKQKNQVGCVAEGLQGMNRTQKLLIRRIKPSIEVTKACSYGHTCY